MICSIYRYEPMKTLKKTGARPIKTRRLSIRYLLPALAAAWACASSPGGPGVSVGKVLKGITGEPVVPREANRILVREFMGSAGALDARTKLVIRVRELIAAEGRLAIVGPGSEADLILEGAVRGLETRPLKYNEMGLVVWKRTRITASLRLYDRNREREIFFEREIQAFEEFSDIEPPVVSESMALDRTVEALAKRIASQAIRGSYKELLTPVEKGRK